jgi:DNA primase
LASHQHPQNDDRQRVLDATDIVRLVGDHVTLKPKGREYACLCPFHNDRNPSMCVVPGKQIFYCFVCNSGGGAIDFVMKFHGMSYGEALKYLAERAGIELTPWKPTRRAPTNDSGDGEQHPAMPEVAGVPREALVFANTFALDFFRTILRHPEHGSVARAVVEQRRISPEMVEKFQIGASPDRWDGLLKTIEHKGYDVEPFVAAGLLKRRESGGGFYDALRNRLIFPIFDQAGRPIAFGGRKIKPEDEPKYLNSPETDLFKKSTTLFALPQAFRAIQQQRCAIITEGYTDAIACHQAGFENVVATLGTALTPKHASVLRRTCDRVVLLFDGDEAGQNAADRALEVFFTESVDVQVMSLPGGKDPDEVLKHEGGADVFRAQFAAAEDMLEFRFARKASDLKAKGIRPGSAAHTRVIEEDLTRLVELGINEVSPLRKSTIVRRYAAIAGVPEQVIQQTLDSRRSRTTMRREESQDAAPVTGGSFVPRSAGEEALACVLAVPGIAESRREAVSLALTTMIESGAEGPALSVAQWTLDVIDAGGTPTVAALMQGVDDAGARQLAAGMAQVIERRTSGDEALVVSAFDDAMRRMDSQRARRNIDALLNVQQTPPGTASNTERATSESTANPNNDTSRLQQLIELRRASEEKAGPMLTIPRPVAAFRTG